MHGTTDATEYEHFNYRLYDQEPLTLDEAIKKAAELRRNDTSRVHHVVPADREGTKFCVDSSQSGKIQNERWSRWMADLLSYMLMPRIRGG